MRVRWTVQARSDLVRLYGFLAVLNPKAAIPALDLLRPAPARLKEHPRLRPRLGEFAPREVRRLLVGDYEIRCKIQKSTIIILAFWHTKEDR